MKVIFLDFDGVLNHLDHFRATSGKRSSEAEGLDIECVKRLNRIIEATGAKVCVSSTWRLGKTLCGLRDILNDRGFVGKVVGKTPELRGVSPAGTPQERGDEIQRWINDWTRPTRGVDSFVILDDDSDMAHLKHLLVQTSFHDGGLLDCHVERAIRILNNPTDD
jgi:hypothetical protein